MSIARILATKGGQVFTVRQEQSIRQALALLAEHNVGALVVVDPSGQPIGILSERDIVRHLARNEHLFSEAVGTVMTQDVVVGTPQDDLTSVAHTMTEKRIRHLPVMHRGELAGIVSLGDIVKAQRDQYEGEVDTLQIQLIESQDKVIKR
jgi:CBS domain-containing protein